MDLACTRVLLSLIPRMLPIIAAIIAAAAPILIGHAAFWKCRLQLQSLPGPGMPGPE